MLLYEVQGMQQHGCSGCTQIFGTSPFAPTDFEASSTIYQYWFETQSSPGCPCTRRSKFLTHSLNYLKCQAILSQNNFYFLYFQRYPTDRAYFIAKEILMTERTYKKDLEILNLVSGFSRSVPSFLPQTFYILQPSRYVQTTIVQWRIFSTFLSKLSDGKVQTP